MILGFQKKKCSFMREKRENAHFQQNVCSYTDNDSNAFFKKYRILYFDIGDSKNCSNFIKYTYGIYHMFYWFSEENNPPWAQSFKVLVFNKILAHGLKTIKCIFTRKIDHDYVVRIFKKNPPTRSQNQPNALTLSIL